MKEIETSYNPKESIFLPNGNILVSSYNGYGEKPDGNNTNNHGHITEYDGTTGEKIATRMLYSGYGQIGNNAVYRPQNIRLDPKDNTELFVYEYGTGKILHVDMTTWKTIDVIVAPPKANIRYAYGMDVSADKIVIASNSSKAIVSINRSDKSLDFILPASEVNVPNIDFRDVAILPDNRIAFSNYADGAVYFIHNKQHVDIPFETPETPEGFEIEWDKISEGFNTDTWVRTVHIDETDKIKDEKVLYQRI